MSGFANTFKLLRLGDAGIRRNPLFYPRARRWFAALEGEGAGGRRARGQLERSLKAAMGTPYGRRVKGGLQLSSWPLLDKVAVRNDSAAFRAPCTWFAVGASTGGTTGVPLRISRSLNSVAVEQASIDLLLERLGVRLQTARMAVLRADSIKDPADRSPPFWILTHGGSRLVLSSHHLSSRTVADYADVLEKFRPDILWVYPTALEALCRLLAVSGRRVAVPAVLASSEVLSAAAWELARETLGECAIVDYYGQAERVACAYAFRPGEYRFLPGYSHVELIACQAQSGLSPAAEDGHAHYEIVGTSLWNLAMPLVRYRTGDLVRLPASWGGSEIGEVAYGMRSFGGVIGRSGEFLISPEGARIVGINHFPREVEHVLRIQVVQERSDFVRIRVLAAPGYSNHDAERLMRNVRAKLPDSMQVQIETTHELERAANGKTPYVVHRAAVLKSPDNASNHATGSRT